MLTLLLTHAALACGGPTPGLQLSEALGWTEDGRYFAFRGADVQQSEEDTDAVVTDVFGIVDTREDRLALRPEEELPAWLAEHPLVTRNTAATCGEASRFGRVEHLGGFPEEKEPSLDQGALRLLGVESVAVLGVEHGGRTWVHAELDTGSRFSTRYFGPEVQATWAPDCRQIAWTISGFSPSSGSTGPWAPQLPVLVRPVGPYVHVMAHPDASATVDPVLASLERAGFQAHVGPKALGDREKTAIYTSGSARPEAEAMAAALGGAPVEPITWYTPADIVVATGREAAR